MCRHSNSTNAEAFAVMQFVHMIDTLDRSQDPILRISMSHSPTLQDSRAPWTGHHACATEALQLRNPTGMIEMHMRAENEFYVFNANTQRPDVGHDLLRRLGQSSVNQHMAGFRRDQNRTQAVRT